MMKYLIGVGALVLALGGYFVLVPEETPPEQASAPDAQQARAPEAVVPANEPVPAATPEASLETMAADVRESLPSSVTDTLTLTDVLFLPRMRIMEYNYVTIADDSRATAREMRTLIEARTETICLEGEEMFGIPTRRAVKARTLPCRIDARNLWRWRLPRRSASRPRT